MKRIVFLSKSRLARNLLELIVPAIPKKVHYTGCPDLTVLAKTNFAKPVQLVLIDENFCSDSELDVLTKTLQTSAFQSAKRLAFANKSSARNRDQWDKLRVSHVHIKPFLAEELANLIEKNLGPRP
jgi:hypothetical protein